MRSSPWRPRSGTAASSPSIGISCRCSVTTFCSACCCGAALPRSAARFSCGGGDVCCSAHWRRLSPTTSWRARGSYDNGVRHQRLERSTRAQCMCAARCPAMLRCRPARLGRRGRWPPRGLTSRRRRLASAYAGSSPRRRPHPRSTAPQRSRRRGAKPWRASARRACSRSARSCGRASGRRGKQCRGGRLRGSWAERWRRAQLHRRLLQPRGASGICSSPARVGEQG